MKHYLNNAGASLMSQATIDAMIGHLSLESQVGGYQAAAERKSQIANFYELAAKLVAAPSASSIAFMDSASRAWDMALYGLPIHEGEEIITLSSEFGTNLVSLFHFASKTGAKIRVISCDNSGSFDMSELRDRLSAGARCVAISHAAAHGSIVNPVEEIGKLAAEHGALYLVDGCQAAGQMEIDVEMIGCDAYTVTGRKWLRGPRGTGFLYVRQGSSISPIFVDLASADLLFSENKAPIGVTIRDDARKFELWERSIASVLGFENALGEYLALDRVTAHAKMRAAATSIRQSIAERDDLQLLGEVRSDSAIIGFYTLDIIKENKLRRDFEAAGLQASTMNDWDCPLHFPKNGAKNIFRLAPHYYTQDETIDLAVETIRLL